MSEHFPIATVTAGEVKPLYEGVNAPDFGPTDDVDPRFEGDVYIAHIPENLELSETQRKAFEMAAKAAAEEAKKPTLEQMYAEMWASEPASEDNRELFRPTRPLGRTAVGPRPTSTEQNANEARHRAQAKKDRWGK